MRGCGRSVNDGSGPDEVNNSRRVLPQSEPKTPNIIDFLISSQADSTIEAVINYEFNNTGLSVCPE